MKLLLQSSREYAKLLLRLFCPFKRIVEGSAQPTKRCNAILSFSNKFLSKYGRTVLRIKGMVSKQA